MSTLASLFRDMHKRSIERHAGRISKIAGHWEAATPPDAVKLSLDNGTGGGEMTPDGYIHWSKSFKGEYMRLVKGPSVWCGNRDYFVQWTEFKQDVASVKYSFCRKCPFYQKSDREYRYPRCMHRADKNPRKAAAVEFLEDLNTATRTVDEMMGKSVSR